MLGWKAAQLRGYLGKELSEQYSGGGEATLSRQESTYADDFAEWAYSYIRMSTGRLLFYCDTKIHCFHYAEGLHCDTTH